MARKKNLEDIYYPVQHAFNPIAGKPPLNGEIIKRIIQGAVKGAYRLKAPSLWDYEGNPIRARPVATEEQMQMVISLIESLQPTDAIEAALASQFAITYIRGMENSLKEHCTAMMDFFDFGHKVLEAYQKYRNKGAQQIHVQYNHNVNNGQVVNIKGVGRDMGPEEDGEISVSAHG